MKVQLIAGGVIAVVAFWAGWDWNGHRLGERHNEVMRQLADSTNKALEEQKKEIAEKSAAVRAAETAINQGLAERQELRNENAILRDREPVVVTEYVEQQAGDVACAMPDVDGFVRVWNFDADPAGNALLTTSEGNDPALRESDAT